MPRPAVRDVIEAFLAELRYDLTPAQRQHNAAALIARLADHDPPLLICTPDEMKE